jgi:hypothetical protein
VVIIPKSVLLNIFLDPAISATCSEIIIFATRHAECVHVCGGHKNWWACTETGGRAQNWWAHHRMHHCGLSTVKQTQDLMNAPTLAPTNLLWHAKPVPTKLLVQLLRTHSMLSQHAV